MLKRSVYTPDIKIAVTFEIEYCSRFGKSKFFTRPKRVIKKSVKSHSTHKVYKDYYKRRRVELICSSTTNALFDQKNYYKHPYYTHIIHIIGIYILPDKINQPNQIDNRPFNY
jgi:hypothetical protein